MVMKSRRICATSNTTRQHGTLMMDKQLSLTELRKIAQNPPNGTFLMLLPFAFTLGGHLPSRRQLRMALAVSHGLRVGPGKGICSGIAVLPTPET